MEAGFLLVDKPVGVTSRDVVVQVRRHLRQTGSKAQIGHCGTLDPLATGLLVLAIGPATSLTPWFQGGDKSYVGTFQMGVTSPSLDVETPQTPVDLPACPTEVMLQSACRSFIGTITQVPPKFSAVHVQGKRAYQLARSGKSFEVPPRNVRIDRLVLQPIDWPFVQLQVDCSGGTYVRTLGDDLAQKLGTHAVMTALQRTASSRFKLEQASDLNSLLENPHWRDLLIPIADAVCFMPQVTVDRETSRRFRNGLVTHQLDRQLEAVWQARAPRVTLDDPATEVATPPDPQPVAPLAHESDDSEAESVDSTVADSTEADSAVADSTEVLVLLEDRRPVGIAYRRPRPDREWPWRIKLNLAQWLER